MSSNPPVAQGLSTDHRGARDESEHRRAGKIGLSDQLRVAHGLADRIDPLASSDEDASGEQTQPRVGVEECNRTLQRPLCPPGVIVSERYVVSGRHPGSDGSSNGAMVVPQRHDGDIR